MSAITDYRDSLVDDFLIEAASTFIGLAQRWYKKNAIYSAIDNCMALEPFSVVNIYFIYHPWPYCKYACTQKERAQIEYNQRSASKRLIQTH